MATSAPPNYYAILQVSESATAEQIRAAYKRAALKTHPDRVAEDSPDRPLRTRQFQLVNDAYYTLYNASRRREYDSQRRMFGGGSSSGRASHASPESEDEDGDDPFASTFPGGFPGQGQNMPSGTGTGAGAGAGAGPAGAAFSWAWNYFAGPSANAQQEREARQTAEEAQFGDVFEEMLREEGLGPDAAATGDNGTKGALAKFWGMVGGVSGGAIGFIVANVPGMVAGAVAGNRLGAIRDARGKSVYAVFQELPQSDRARLLSQLAARVFSHAVGI